MPLLPLLLLSLLLTVQATSHRLTSVESCTAACARREQDAEPRVICNTNNSDRPGGRAPRAKAPAGFEMFQVAEANCFSKRRPDWVMMLFWL
ncbi:hypothetical protein BD289DRAFT_15310 [Coniella lustricola]|uniref:Secreted protein n=1 Tax=Coniella lustricola TaxID=2025994 RepID=A0A2T3A3X5_9PEZI|nr:hypothetical protein BD289DRAFT_15310 [Coniella lustricola]